MPKVLFMKDVIPEPVAATVDPIAEFEQQRGGKHWSEFSETESFMMLLHAVSANGAKNAINQMRGDTHFGMNWAEFKELMTAKGFELVLTDNFRHYDKPELVEEFICLAHKEAGLLCTATSYGLNIPQIKTSVNEGRVTGQLIHDSGMYFTRREGSNGYYKDEEGNNVLCFEIDVRERLFTRLDSMCVEGSYLPTWKVKPFIDLKYSFHDYSYDHAGDPDGYNEFITKQLVDRVSKLPEWVKTMINISVIGVK